MPWAGRVPPFPASQGSGVRLQPPDSDSAPPAACPLPTCPLRGPLRRQEADPGWPPCSLPPGVKQRTQFLSHFQGRAEWKAQELEGADLPLGVSGLQEPHVPALCRCSINPGRCGKGPLAGILLESLRCSLEVAFYWVHALPVICPLGYKWAIVSGSSAPAESGWVGGRAWGGRHGTSPTGLSGQGGRGQLRLLLQS